MDKNSTLLVACGALARDVIDLRDAHGWSADITCVPALLHNTPSKIAPAVERKICAMREHYTRIIVVYGDCGTSGELDAALARLGVERVAGPHCYEQFAGAGYERVMDATPGTYFLTDFLVRHFDALVWRGLGLDRHPELLADYFGNYEQVIYLAQRDDADLARRAVAAAERLRLPLYVQPTGGGDLETRLCAFFATPIDYASQVLSV